MEKKKRMAVPPEVSSNELEALELLNHFSPELMRPRDYTMLGIHRYYLNAGDWETPLREGILHRDSLAAEYMAKIAREQGDRRKAEAYKRCAKWLSVIESFTPLVGLPPFPDEETEEEDAGRPAVGRE